MTSGEVHCWCASLDVPPETSARLYATLTSDERNRSARLRFERDRHHFIVAHGVLRDLLGRYLETDPGRIRYTYNTFGKPHLSPEFGSPVTFNLSHSAGLALIAVAADAHVGIDVESTRVRADYAEIARGFFSAVEVEELNALPSHRYAHGFFSCWTRKEAYLKACGEGLMAAHHVVPATGWSFYTLEPAPGYIGALAIEGSGWRVSQCQWTSAGR